MVSPHRLEFRLLGVGWESDLARFFAALKEAGDEKFFHPHPLTMEEAKRRCRYTGEDFYYICADGTTVLGYGMLRGWDAGYETPSLGIAIGPLARGKGLGTAFVYFLHTVARWRGAETVRIRVCPDNNQALRLYKKIGYQISGEEDGQYVALYHLAHAPGK